MKILRVVNLSIFSLLLASCAVTPKAAPPAWLSDVYAVYPQERYVIGHGYGANRQSAENAALSAISQYFNQKISTETVENTTVDTEGRSSSAINANTFIQSQTDLFAVRYTQAYHNEGLQEWETVAYIDRGEAWNIYEPKLKQKTDAFIKIYTLAEKETDTFKKVVLYTKAVNYSIENNFSAMLNFAQILAPSQSMFYSDTRDILSDIPSKITKASSLSSIFIECDNDSDNLVYAAISKSLNNIGFPLSKDKTKAVYVCNADIEENLKELAAGTFYTPVITADITGKNGNVFSYSATVNRTGAKDPVVAKKRMYQAIANECEKTFTKELTRKETE
jgi:hypothetical protein